MASISVKGDKVEVRSRYNRDFARFMRSIGAEWDRERRVWVADRGRLNEIREKMEELGLSEGGAARLDEVPVYIRLSRRNRNVLVIKMGEMVIVASVSDVRELLDGRREYVRARRLR